jgi:hypothetical protein
MGPARDTNHSANSPKLSTESIVLIQKDCHTGLSSIAPHMMSPSMRKKLEDNAKDQKNLLSLKKYSTVLNMLIQSSETDVEYATFPMKLWQFQEDVFQVDQKEKDFYTIVALVVIDYWGLFKRTGFD